MDAWWTTVALLGAAASASAGLRAMLEARRRRNLVEVLRALGLEVTRGPDHVHGRGVRGPIALEVWIAEGPRDEGDPRPLPKALNLSLILRGPSGFVGGESPPEGRGRPGSRDALTVAWLEAPALGARADTELRLDYTKNELRLELYPNSAQAAGEWIDRWWSFAEQRAADPQELPRTLSTLSRDDPRPATRASALLTLARSWPGAVQPSMLDERRLDPAPEVRIAVMAIDSSPEEDRVRRRVGLNDPDPAVRLEAAARLGAEGREGLEQLIRAAETPFTLRRRALEVLREELTWEAQAERWAHLAECPDPQAWLAVQALEELPASVAEGCLDRLRPLTPLATERLIGTLERRGRLQALTAHLDEKDPGPREQVVDALGRIGDRSVLALLRRVAVEDPVLVVRRAAQVAAELVQERVGGSPGSVGLVPLAETGALSPRQGEIGAVAEIAPGPELRGAGPPRPPPWRRRSAGPGSDTPGS